MHNTLDPVMLSGGQVLRDHGRSGHIQGAGNNTHDMPQLIAHAGEGRDCHTIGIDIGHQEKHGQDDQRLLCSHGNAHTQKILQNLPLGHKAPESEVKAELRPAAVEIDQGHHEGHPLPHNCGQGRAEHTHPQPSHKYQIQDQIGPCRYGDKDQRSSAVTHTTQNCTDQIIAKDKDHAAIADHSVVQSILPGLCRQIQKPQLSLHGTQCCNHQRHRQPQQEGKAGADDPVQGVIVLLPHVLGDHDLPGGGKACGNKGTQGPQIAAGGHGRQACAAHIPPNHHHIHHVIGRLQ